jgi:hypothetical protein
MEGEEQRVLIGQGGKEREGRERRRTSEVKK